MPGAPSALPSLNLEAACLASMRGVQVICYRGDPDAREEVWRHQMRGGRGGQAGPGTHVVLTTYSYLMSPTDRFAGREVAGHAPIAACPG